MSAWKQQVGICVLLDALKSSIDTQLRDYVQVLSGIALGGVSYYAFKAVKDWYTPATANDVPGLDQELKNTTATYWSGKDSE